LKADVRLLDRAAELLERAPGLYMGAEEFQGKSAKQEAWLTSAMNVIDLLAPGMNSQYRNRARIIELNKFGPADNRVDMVAAILTALLEDVDAGILPPFSDGVRSEIFEEFLSHAEHYIRRKKPHPAGVIAGVVFEDTIRRACERHKIHQKGVDLDKLITYLNQEGHLSDVKAKNARGSAGLRTSATHAQWDEFDAADVQATIKLTRDLITDLLSN